MASTTETESDRIRAAYQRYSTDPREVARRNPSNPGLQAIHQEWRRKLAGMLVEVDLRSSGARVLDVGCGNGSLLEWFVGQGIAVGNCAGVDLIDGRVLEARQRLPEAQIVTADARSIPFGDATFDIVSLSMVISSVLDRRAAADICEEVARVLTPTGILVWYDTRIGNPRNRDVRGIGRAEMASLFVGFAGQVASITLAPPLARHLGRATALLYPLFAALPLLRVRNLAVLQRKPLRGV